MNMIFSVFIFGFRSLQTHSMQVFFFTRDILAANAHVKDVKYKKKKINKINNYLNNYDFKNYLVFVNLSKKTWKQKDKNT